MLNQSSPKLAWLRPNLGRFWAGLAESVQIWPRLKHIWEDCDWIWAEFDQVCPELTLGRVRSLLGQVRPESCKSCPGLCNIWTIANQVRFHVGHFGAISRAFLGHPRRWNVNHCGTTAEQPSGGGGGPAPASTPTLLEGALAGVGNQGGCHGAGMRREPVCTRG